MICKNRKHKINENDLTQNRPRRLLAGYLQRMQRNTCSTLLIELLPFDKIQRHCHLCVEYLNAHLCTKSLVDAVINECRMIFYALFYVIWCKCECMTGPILFALRILQLFVCNYISTIVSTIHRRIYLIFSIDLRKFIYKTVWLAHMTFWTPLFSIE